MPRVSSFQKPANAESAPKAEQTKDEYPTNQKRIIIMVALYLSLFLVTLDQNIISTAIPRITDEFHSLDDVGWYGTAYLLTACSFQLLMGKIYKYYPVKPVFLTCCFLFEVGSAICGAAPNSTAFIIGRAVAGLGTSGLFSGILVILFLSVPLQQRPIYQGLFGAIFAAASVVGPLIGGSFTDKVTWRWCFYINIPIGAVSIIITMLLVHVPNQKLEDQAQGWTARVKQLDPIGNLAFFPGIVCMVLALQWGGTKYAWSDARIIVLLILFSILCLVFVAIQIWKDEKATVPPRIMKQRSIAAAAWFGFWVSAGMMVIMYYLPIWFQAIKGKSAVESGIALLPVMLATVSGTLSSGFIISKVGYYNPFFFLSSIMMPIGAGLMTTFTPSTGAAQWIGYQIIYGLGLGFGAQLSLIVSQAVLDKSDIATGSALIMFLRFLGPSVCLPVAQNVFLDTLVSRLTNLPGITPDQVLNTGATDLKNLASGDDLKVLVSDYNRALIAVLYSVVATSCLTVVGSVLVEWRSLKASAQKQGEKAQKCDQASEVQKGDQASESQKGDQASELQGNVA